MRGVPIAVIWDSHDPNTGFCTYFVIEYNNKIQSIFLDVNRRRSCPMIQQKKDYH